MGRYQGEDLWLEELPCIHEASRSEIMAVEGNIREGRAINSAMEDWLDDHGGLVSGTWSAGGRGPPPEGL